MSAPLPIYVTNSELGRVRECEKRWEFAYKQLLVPRSTARPLTVGSAVHEGIAELYRFAKRKQDEHGALWRMSASDLQVAMVCAHDALNRSVAERIAASVVPQFETGDAYDGLRSESEESVAEALAALRLFAEHILWSDVERFDVVAVEKAFEVPLPNERGNLRSNVWLRGRMDLVLRERSTNRVYLGEHKTTAGAAHEQDARLDVDPQPRAYGFALRHLYGEAYVREPTVLLNVVRKREPSTPSINKDGTVSTAACDTLRSTYDDARDAAGDPSWLIDARLALDGVDPGHARFAKLQAKLRTTVDRWATLQAKQDRRAEQLPTSTARWAHRSEHIIELDAIDQWRRDVHATVRSQLRALHAGRRSAVRNGSSCIGIRPCPYRTICVDETAERQSLYDLRVHAHAEAIDEEPERA